MSGINIQKVPEVEDRSLSIFAEFDQLTDRIREHAFSLFDGRGGEPGHAMEDWLKAEQKICYPAFPRSASRSALGLLASASILTKNASKS